MTTTHNQRRDPKSRRKRFNLTLDPELKRMAIAFLSNKRGRTYPLSRWIDDLIAAELDRVEQRKQTEDPLHALPAVTKAAIAEILARPQPRVTPSKGGNRRAIDQDLLASTATMPEAETGARPRISGTAPA